jgi:hypothetical protein
LSLPCLQTLWNGSGLCTYHEKIAGGLLEPAEPSLRPPGWRQARRPKIAIIGDGSPADALSQMFSWTDQQPTQLELATDRGRGVTETLGSRKGLGKPKGR